MEAAIRVAIQAAIAVGGNQVEVATQVQCEYGISFFRIPY